MLRCSGEIDRARGSDAGHRNAWSRLRALASQLDAALPIGVKLLVPLFVIAAVSNALLARTVYVYEAGRIRKEFVARAFVASNEVHNHAVASRTAEQIRNHDYFEMQMQLDSLVVSTPSLVRVELLQVDGESATIRASSDHGRIGETEGDPSELGAELHAVHSDANVSREDHVGDTPTLLAALPFDLPGGATFVVAMHMSTVERDHALAALLRRFEIGVAPGLLLTAVVLAGGVHILVNRRLRSVLAAADDLQSGDLAARVEQGAPRDPHDEMLRLAVRFNSMAAAIEKLHTDVEGKAITDELTGLYNRRFIMDTLEREVVRAYRHGEPLSVLMADLDGLKQVNDGMGHQAGDEAIRFAAAALRAALRDVDYAGRIGGDELAAVLPNCDEAGLATVLDRLQRACGMRLADGIVCTLSSGGAVFHRGDSAHTLLGRADRVLYEVKRAGKNNSRIAA